MIVTTRSEYGMRAMILLAEREGDQPLSAQKMSCLGKIPRKYLEQILRDLKQAGLISAQVGARGGYRLARPSARISAGEVIRCLDQMNIMTCVGEHRGPPCDHIMGCSLRPLWQRLHQAMQDVLDATSLQQLVQEACMSADGAAPGGAALDVPRSAFAPARAEQERPPDGCSGPLQGERSALLCVATAPMGGPEAP